MLIYRGLSFGCLRLFPEGAQRIVGISQKVQLPFQSNTVVMV